MKSDVLALRVKSCKMASVVSSDEDEKYVVLIFEKELTLSEQIMLEEIFTEMGKRNNISCFPAKLSFEEASIRLKTHQCAQNQEVGQGMQLKYICHLYDVPNMLLSLHQPIVDQIWWLKMYL